MPDSQPEFCLSRAEDGHFEPMRGYRGRVKTYYGAAGEFVSRAGDFDYRPPRHMHDFMEYLDDIEIFELASPGR